MAGIYIHIPFCRHKCHYCNFFSTASKKLKNPFLNALKKEIALTRNYLAGETVGTIYFGGGTPSLYRPGDLQEVMEELIPFWEEGGNISSVPKEITLELNPEDVTEEYVAALKKTWFNRFSLGVQSFFDEDLVYLNRAHSGKQAWNAVKLLQHSGYENISIDLIYGIPASSSERWQENLETAFSLGVPHLSAYALTVETGTSLAWMIDKQRSAAVSDEAQVGQFKLLMKKAREHGFLHYEISNFCKPGRHSIHNANYWNGIHYLGLGPSAHSYNGTSRRWNLSNLSKYIDCLEKGDCLYEQEVLTNSQKYNEYVMTSLRTMWGWDFGKIICDLGFGIYDLRFTICDLIRMRAGAFVQQGLMVEHDGVYFLTDEGKLFADRIASELFMTGED